MFYCCSADDGYERLGRDQNTERPEEETMGKIPEMNSAELSNLADEAELKVAAAVPEPEPVVEVVEEKEIEIYIDTDENAPVESWGTDRVLATLNQIKPGDEKKKPEQAKISKVLKRLVELCEAKQPALEVWEANGVDLLLGLLPRFSGLNAIEGHICNAIQFLCARPEADAYDFPSNGAAPLKAVIVENLEHMPTLIASLDCLGVFARVSEQYIDSTIESGVVSELFDLMRRNMNNEEAFTLQISLTRVVVSISRSPDGRQALGEQSINLLLDCMRSFDKVQNLVGNCTEALWYLCLEKENCFRMLDQDLTVMLTDTMRNKYVGQDLHTKIITLLHQLISQEGVPDRFVRDARGIELLSELLIDNETVSENYIVILQVWITLLAHASADTRSSLIDNAFINKRISSLASVLVCSENEARESALTLMLIAMQANSDGTQLLAQKPDIVSGLLRVTEFQLSTDAIQCLMVIYYQLAASFETQAVLFEGGIMSFLASDWYTAPGISGEAIKSAAAALIRLYANKNYHQELDDKANDLRNLVSLRSLYPAAAGVLSELEQCLDRISQASSVFVTVAAPQDEKEMDGEGEGVPLKQPASVNVKLSVGQAVQVYSKSQDDWLDGKIRDIADGRICVVYGNREKWLKQSSKQWRPREEQINQAARTRSGTTARRQEEEKESANAGGDEEPSQDYENAEPGAATEEDAPPPPTLDIDLNAQDVIDRSANQRLESPRPPETAVARPATRRQTQAADHEMDYDVTFPDKKLGLELRPGDNNANCVVSRTLNEFTEKRIDEEAYIVQVNGQWVKDLPFDTIYQIIVTATKNPPLTIMFRGVKDERDDEELQQLLDDNVMGTLKVHVVEALQLTSRARYAKVKVLGEKKSTSMVAATENPSWPDTLEFANFRPSEGQMASVSVYSQNRLLKDNKVGTVTFPLPRSFYKLERHSNLELLGKKDALAGSVSVTCILTQKTVRESHALRNIRFSAPPEGLDANEPQE